jgi:hypothetical protein
LVVYVGKKRERVLLWGTKMAAFLPSPPRHIFPWFFYERKCSSERGKKEGFEKIGTNGTEIGNKYDK